MDIDNLQIVIGSESANAAKDIDQLINRIQTLQTVADKGAGGLSAIAQNITSVAVAVNKVNTTNLANLVQGLKALGSVGNVKLSKSLASQITNIAAAASNIQPADGANISALANGLNSLKGISEIKVSATLAKNLAALNAAIKGIQWTDGDKLRALADGLRPLSELGKANLTTFINQLGKLPSVISELDKADMGKFAAQIREVAAAIQPLANEMNRVAAGFSAFPSRIQQIITSNSQLVVSNNITANSFNGLSNVLTRARARALAYIIVARKLVSLISDWINESNSYIENLNLFNAAMGEYAESAQKYAEQVGEIMGIDPSDWMRNQGVFMTLATGFGVVTEKAAVMSQQLTQLGYDISSFYNMSVEDAMQKLQSGISGELEPLRRLGYDLSQAKLQQIAFANGIDQSVASMTQAQKAQLRYHAIMTQVTQVQGDMARTLDAPANQLRVLKAQITQTARALGNIFIPMLNAVLPYLIAFLKVVRQVADALAALFGFTLPEVDYSGLKNLSSGADDITDALGGASAAAKELKGQLAGFDEITLISQTESGGGGGTGTGIGGDLGLPLETYDFLGDAVNKRVEEIEAKLKPIIEKLKNNLLPVLDDILRFVGAIALGLLAWKIGRLFTSDLRILWGLFLAVSGAVELITSAIDAWKNGLDFGNLTGMLTGTLALTAGLALMFGKVGAAIGLLVGGITALVVGFKEWIEQGELTRESAFAVEGGLLAIGAALSLILGPIPIIVAGIAAFVVELTRLTGHSDELISGLKQTFGGFVDFFKGIFTNDIELATQGLYNIFDGLGNTIGAVIDSVRDGLIMFIDWIDEKTEGRIKPIIESVKTALTNTVENIKTVLNGLLTFISGVFNGDWERAWNGLKEIFRGFVNGIITLFESSINSIIGKVNTVLLGIGDLGATFGVDWNIPQLPTITLRKFASGGFPETGQMFLARESGPELVGTIGGQTAVANNDQIVNGIAQGVASANEEQNALLRQQNALLMELINKEWSLGDPNASFGRFASRSLDKYAAVTGRA